MSTGWTWDHVESTVTMDRLTAFNSYWAKHPPIHHLVAGYMGYEPPKKGNLSDLINIAGEGILNKTGNAGG
jgi:hypothetical protein